MQNKELINWTNLSILLANNTTSIRKDNYPKKYKERIEYLMWLLDKFKEDKEVFSKDEVNKYLKTLEFP